ncbi:MAG TPA: response regulator [Candidatus Acidoferrales bacterium]|nr:response regulator [Candidatus Acidoferrales bacterium]
MPQQALIVDDDLPTCQLIQAILRSADVETSILTDSARAAELLHRRKFDSIFLDINMPAPNGIELTKMIRAPGPNQKTPVVIITGDEDPTLLSVAFEAGANFFLFKPINKQRLLNLARAAHSAFQQEKRRYQRVVVSCPVQVARNDEILDGETIDMSLNGVLVRTSRCFAVESPVTLRISLPNSVAPILTAGKVARMAGPHMAIQIENIAVEASKRLQEFLLPRILATKSTY